MIAVKVTQNELTVNGHAGYAETGNDIVCAAVSALAQNLIQSIEALTQDRISYQIQEGHIGIQYKNLSEQGKLLVDSFFIGICALANTYGENYVHVF